MGVALIRKERRTDAQTGGRAWRNEEALCTTMPKCLAIHMIIKGVTFTRSISLVLAGFGIATGYGLHGPGIESRWGARFSAPVQTGHEPHPTSCTMGTGYFRGVMSGKGVTLTPHPLLVPWPRKGRAIPLLPLWAVRPVQSLSACTRLTFTFTLYRINEIINYNLTAFLC